MTYERTRLTVVQSGLEAGRTVVDPRGARIDLGVAADARGFESHFLAMLKGRSSRPTTGEVNEGGGMGHVRPRRAAAARGVDR